MTACDFVDFFTGCCSEVLDTMYFTTVLDAVPETELRPLRQGDFAFSLNFQGDVSGSFGLHLDYSTAYSLASNFLGEDRGELPCAEVGDVISELANMLCGAVMSRVPSTHKFVLSHPEALASSLDLRREDALIARLATDTGVITTWVVVTSSGEIGNGSAARGTE
jgi:CheY-specific phosphatase CheX